MKKILYILFLFCSISFGQITLSNSNAISNNNVSSLSITLNVSSGDALGVLAVQTAVAAGTPTSVTDSNGANWIQIVWSGWSENQGVFYTTDLATTGSRTITFNYSHITNFAMVASTFQGIDTVSPYVKHEIDGNNTGQPSATITPDFADSLIYFMAGTDSNETYSTYGAGQIEIAQVAEGGSPSKRVSAVATYEIATSTSANTQSCEGVGAVWSAKAVEFKAAGSPPAARRIFNIN